jgi:hypothetical protein
MCDKHKWRASGRRVTYPLRPLTYGRPLDAAFLPNPPDRDSSAGHFNSNTNLPSLPVNGYV